MDDEIIDLQTKNFFMTENNFRFRKGIKIFVKFIDKSLPSDMHQMKMTASNIKQIR